jgi:hypothetical protein
METLAKDSGNILACLQKRLVRAMLSYVLLQAMFDPCVAAPAILAVLLFGMFDRDFVPHEKCWHKVSVKHAKK